MKEQRNSPGRIFTYETLPEKGIRYSRNHIRKLISKKKFPKPFFPSERVPAWTERVLDQWIIDCEAEQASGANDQQQSARREAARSAARKRHATAKPSAGQGN
jgi:predicted DNA-binding transcriptional regulator AlpA